VSGRVEFVDASDDIGFELVRAALDVTIHAHVVVAEHATARHIPRPRLALHRLIGPLGDLAAELGVHLRPDKADQVVAQGAAIEPRPVGVEPDLDAGRGDALQLAERLVAIAPAEARGVAQDERRERRARADDVEQARTLDQLLRLCA